VEEHDELESLTRAFLSKGGSIEYLETIEEPVSKTPEELAKEGKRSTKKIRSLKVKEPAPHPRKDCGTCDNQKACVKNYKRFGELLCSGAEKFVSQDETTRQHHLPAEPILDIMDWTTRGSERPRLKRNGAGTWMQENIPGPWEFDLPFEELSAVQWMLDIDPMGFSPNERAIAKMLVAGVPKQEILKTMKVSDADFRKYKKRLTEKAICPHTPYSRREKEK